MKSTREIQQTPLAVFVGERLAELGMRQSEFCRLTGFDQGLLSKILSSQITHISLESALKLTTGLAVSPTIILALIGRYDLHELIMASYVTEFSSESGRARAGAPEPAAAHKAASEV